MFNFGGDTGLTYEALQRRRQIAEQLMQRGDDARPRYAVEGIGQGLSKIAGALMDRKLGKKEDAMRGEFNEQANAALFGGAPEATHASYAGPQLPQGDRAGAIRQGLLERGMPEHVADAFIMNFQDESGLDPGINEIAPLVPGSRGGFGLYQLTGPRRVAYEQFAQQRGVDPSDVDAQLDFMVMELQGPERRAAERIFAAPDTGSAAAAIVTDFLRPAEEHRNRRVAQYTGGSGGGNNQARIAQLAEIAGSPLASESQRAVAQAMIQREMQASDPMRQMEMERERLEIERLRNPQPELTSGQREYQMAVEQGYAGTFMDYKRDLAEAQRAQTTINNNMGGVQAEPLGTAGQILVPDPSAPGGFRVVVAEGSELDRERKEAEASRERATQTRVENEVTQRDVVLNAVDKIREGLANPGIISDVGVIGARTTGINQQAADIAGRLDTLKGMVVFDRLEQLKQASATGASGLGQVTEREIALLGAQLGALENNLSPEVILETLNTVESVFGRLSPEVAAYLTGETDVMPGATAAGDDRRLGMTYNEFINDPQMRAAAEAEGVSVRDMWEIAQ